MMSFVKHHILLRFYLLATLSVFSSLVSAQGTTIQHERINEYANEHAMEKVYLHVDKDFYLAGETIWFKAYLMNSVTHIPAAEPLNLYVELISSQSKLVKKKIFRAENGTSAGNFKLSDSIADGNYVVRAYTNRMRNKEEAFLFEQAVYISNPDYRHYVRMRELLSNRQFNRSLDKQRSSYSVSFYPEGGSLVRGLPARLAFHVTDKLGRGIPVEGHILDAQGQIIAAISESFRGMGYFEFTPPDAGEYYAQLRLDGDRQSKRFPLPVPLEKGFGMKLDMQDDLIRLRITTNVSPAHENHEGLLLLAYNRGSIVHQATPEFDDGSALLEFKKADLPSGITKFVLFSKDKLALGERLFFNDRLQDQPGFSIEDIHIQDGKASFWVSVSDPLLQNASGSYSLSVTGHPHTVIPEGPDLSSYTQLYSYFSDPIDFSFSNGGSHNGLLPATHTDLLMLVSRWERMQLEDILTRELFDYAHQSSYGISLGGQVVNPANDKALANHRVSLLIKDGSGAEYSAVTDSEGLFSFNGLDFDEAHLVELLPSRMGGGYYPRVVVDVGQGRQVSFKPDFRTGYQKVTRKSRPWTRVKRRQSSPFDIPQYHTSTTSTYGNPSQTIYVTNQSDERKSMVDFLTQRGTGISIMQGQLVIRGVSSMMYSSEPIFMVDDNRVDRGHFLSTRVSDVFRIDIFKGADASIFGVQGTNGAIIAHTRRGGMFGRDGYEFLMSGFSLSSDFDPAIHTMIDSPKEAHQPTLLWIPNLVLGESGKVQINVDVAGFEQVMIVVEGFDQDGRSASKRHVLFLW